MFTGYQRNLIILSNRIYDFLKFTIGYRVENKVIVPHGFGSKRF